MDELVRQIIGYARSSWSYRWWGMVVAWVVGVGGAVGVYFIPDKYEASARIYVDTQSVLSPLMAGLAVPSDVNQQVMMLSRTLINRPNVEKLIRMADLDLKVTDKQQQELLVDSISGRLKITSAGRDNLYTLSYQDERPERAKRVVQSFVSIFIESGLGDKRKDTDVAKRFIEDQIKNYAQKLDEAEARLKDFKIKNIELMGDSGKDSLSQLGDVKAKLAQAKLDLREAENSRDAIKQQLSGEQVASNAETQAGDLPVAVPELDTRIETLKKQLDDLLRGYTESHPDVKGTRAVLASLEKQRNDEIAARRAKMANSPVSTAGVSAMSQQLKMALTEAEATVASLRTRVAEYEARLTQAKGFMRLGPQIEQEYAQLNRDYEINKRNYDSLIARRESANISVEMDSTTGMAEFRLIDPPNVPTKPSTPNRPMLMPGVGVFALLGGVLMAFALSQLRPAFFDGRQLREVSGLPVLGSVSLVPSPAWLRKESRGQIHFVVGLVAYAVFFVALTFVVVFLGRPI